MLEYPCLGNLEPDIETQVNICFLMHSAQGVYLMRRIATCLKVILVI